MKKNLLPKIAALTIGVLLTSFSQHYFGPKTPSIGHSASSDLRTNMRKLWEDHITWTRNAILNIMDDLSGTTDVRTTQSLNSATC